MPGDGVNPAASLSPDHVHESFHKQAARSPVVVSGCYREVPKLHFRIPGPNGHQSTRDSLFILRNQFDGFTVQLERTPDIARKAKRSPEHLPEEFIESFRIFETFHRACRC